MACCYSFSLFCILEGTFFRQYGNAELLPLQQFFISQWHYRFLLSQGRSAQTVPDHTSFKTNIPIGAQMGTSTFASQIKWALGI